MEGDGKPPRHRFYRLCYNIFMTIDRLTTSMYQVKVRKNLGKNNNNISNEKKGEKYNFYKPCLPKPRLNRIWRNAFQSKLESF